MNHGYANVFTCIFLSEGILQSPSLRSQSIANCGQMLDRSHRHIIFDKPADAVIRRRDNGLTKMDDPRIQSPPYIYCIIHH